MAAAPPSVRQFDDDSSIDRAGPQIREHLVDAGQWRRRDRRAHLAGGCEADRLRQVLARAHDRAADRDAFQYHIENSRFEVTRWQSDESHGAFAAHQPQRLVEGARGYGRDEYAVRAAAGELHDLPNGIGGGGIDRKLGAEGARQREFRLTDIE